MTKDLGRIAGDDQPGEIATRLAELAARLQTTCVAARLTVATAESCTGGLIAHTLIRRSGASAYVQGAIVAYADATKEQLLGVDDRVLASHGAVSAQVAREMADGARRRLGADLAVAVTGIAGPDGGSPTKPVGLTYVGVATSSGAEVRRFVWPGDRVENIELTTEAALALLLEHAERVAAG